eukprot:s689_g12.t1
MSEWAVAMLFSKACVTEGATFNFMLSHPSAFRTSMKTCMEDVGFPRDHELVAGCNQERVMLMELLGETEVQCDARPRTDEMSICDLEMLKVWHWLGLEKKLNPLSKVTK